MSMVAVLLVVSMIGGVAFAGCNSDTQKTFTSPMTGKNYKVSSTKDGDLVLTEITVKEMKSITSKTWKLLSPRISFTYDITGDGKNVIRLEAMRNEALQQAMQDWVDAKYKEDLENLREKSETPDLEDIRNDALQQAMMDWVDAKYKEEFNNLRKN